MIYLKKRFRSIYVSERLAFSRWAAAAKHLFSECLSLFSGHTALRLAACFALPLVIFSSCTSTNKVEFERPVTTRLRDLSDVDIYTIGLSLTDEYLKSKPAMKDTEVLTYLNRIGQYMSYHISYRSDHLPCLGGIVKTAPLKGFRFAAVKDDARYTFSLPGGFVFISSGLLSRLTSEDQLAAFLSAEMQVSVCADRFGDTSLTTVANRKVPVNFELNLSREPGAPPLKVGLNLQTRDQLKRVLEKLTSSFVDERHLRSADLAAVESMTSAGYIRSEYQDVLAELTTEAGGKLPYYPMRVGYMKTIKLEARPPEDLRVNRKPRFDMFKERIQRLINNN
jgi:hypothetical protein